MGNGQFHTDQSAKRGAGHIAGLHPQLIHDRGGPVTEVERSNVGSTTIAQIGQANSLDQVDSKPVQQVIKVPVRSSVLRER